MSAREQVCYILRGIPGSGKSYWCRSFAGKHLETVTVSADDFFMVDGEYKFSPYRIGEAHADCMARFLKATRAGNNIIVDNTNIHNWEWKNYATIAHHCGYKVIVIEIPVNDLDELKLCISRNTHSVPADVISRMAIEFEPTPSTTQWEVVRQISGIYY